MTILIVDNDRAALFRTADALQSHYPGAEIIPLDDGMEAVQFALNHTVDAVYTEVLLPHITGFDVARLVRRFRPGAAVRIVSGSDAYLSRACSQGLDGYYLKPLDRAEDLLAGIGS